MMKKNVCIVAVVLFLLSSCASSNQFNGTVTGSMLGSVFGSSIGGLLGGPRGNDAGTMIGMVIGGAVGAAATAPRTQKSTDVSTRSDEYGYENNRDVDEYNRHSRNSETANDTYQSQNSAEQTLETEYRDLQIENLRFVDDNNNRTIDAGERSKIEFELYNRGTETVYNIAPVLRSSEGKRIAISPTAIVASLAPGKGVRYAAELYARPNLHTGTADFTIGFAKGNLIYTVRTFQLATFGK